MQKEMDERLQAEREARERMEREYQQRQESYQHRLDQALQYVSSLGLAMGHSPPQFSPPQPPPFVRAATPVSDLITSYFCSMLHRAI